MKPLLREPLLHFLLLGAALFIVYGAAHREPEARPQIVTVNAGQVEHLAASFARAWQRPPTQAEVQGLIAQHVKEEIFSREAMKLGLDRNDPVIRRRLQQKLEFITEDLLATEEPTDPVLAAFLAKHAQAFQPDGRFTFRQVFLSPAKHAEQLEADAAWVLSELRTQGAAADATAWGDPTLLPAFMEEATQPSIGNTFGPDFAKGLAAATLGEWSGPVRSSFGLHLVFLEHHDAGRVPALAEVRDAVKREWENARRTEAIRRFASELQQRYRVTVEWPKPEPENQTASR